MANNKDAIKALFAQSYQRARCPRTNKVRPVHIINLEQALLNVYDNQTMDEQDAEVTSHANGVGFNGRDAEFGSSLAKQILAGRWLSRNQLAALGRMMPKYWRQLGKMVATVKPETLKAIEAYPEGEPDWMISVD